LKWLKSCQHSKLKSHREPNSCYGAQSRPLGFPPLAKDDREYVRSKIQHARDLWWHFEGKYKYTELAELRKKRLRRALRKLANLLDEASETLVAAGWGGHHALDRLLLLFLTGAISNDGKNGTRSAHQLIREFRADLQRIAQAARVADQTVMNLRNGRAGRPTLSWHNEFTAAVIRVWAVNAIKDTITTRPGERGPERSGAFLNTAWELQQRLLDSRMRARTLNALAQRLERSKKRLRKAHGT
jgi:hypothetical protein